LVCLEDRSDFLQHFPELLVPVEFGGLISAADKLAADEDPWNLKMPKVKKVSNFCRTAWF
jgi:hypothetical protein